MRNFQPVHCSARDCQWMWRRPLRGDSGCPPLTWGGGHIDGHGRWVRYFETWACNKKLIVREITKRRRCARDDEIDMREVITRIFYKPGEAWPRAGAQGKSEPPPQAVDANDALRRVPTLQNMCGGYQCRIAIPSDLLDEAHEAYVETAMRIIYWRNPDTGEEEEYPDFHSANFSWAEVAPAEVPLTRLIIDIDCTQSYEISEELHDHIVRHLLRVLNRTYADQLATDAVDGWSFSPTPPDYVGDHRGYLEGMPPITNRLVIMSCRAEDETIMRDGRMLYHGGAHLYVLGINVTDDDKVNIMRAVVNSLRHDDAQRFKPLRGEGMRSLVQSHLVETERVAEERGDGDTAEAARAEMKRRLSPPPTDREIDAAAIAARGAAFYENPWSDVCDVAPTTGSQTILRGPYALKAVPCPKEQGHPCDTPNCEANGNRRFGRHLNKRFYTVQKVYKRDGSSYDELFRFMRPDLHLPDDASNDDVDNARRTAMHRALRLCTIRANEHVRTPGAVPSELVVNQFVTRDALAAHYAKADKRRANARVVHDDINPGLSDVLQQSAPKPARAYDPSSIAPALWKELEDIVRRPDLPWTRVKVSKVAVSPKKYAWGHMFFFHVSGDQANYCTNLPRGPHGEWRAHRSPGSVMFVQSRKDGLYTRCRCQCVGKVRASGKPCKTYARQLAGRDMIREKYPHLQKLLYPNDPIAPALNESQSQADQLERLASERSLSLSSAPVDGEDAAAEDVVMATDAGAAAALMALAPTSAAPETRHRTKRRRIRLKRRRRPQQTDADGDDSMGRAP